MKKNIYKLSLIMILSLFSGFLTSCNDDNLRIDSPNTIAQKNFYRTEDDFQIAILGVYNDFRASGLYYNTGYSTDIIIFGDLLSDNLISNPFGRRGNYNASNWDYTGASNGTGLYERAYMIVSDANLLLSKVNNLSAESSVRKRVTAEAMALRAIAHFEIAKLFAKIPTQSADASSSQGIAYMTEFNFKAEPKREENIGIVYDKIISDLESALPNLPTGYNPVGEGINRLTQNSLNGILAKVYLFKGNYTKVIEHAKAVVGVEPTKKQDLEAFWKSETNQGALFSLPFSKVNDISIGGNYSQGLTPRTFRAEYVVDKNFANSFNQTTEPERYNSSIMSVTQEGFDPVGPVFAVKKYFQSRSGYNSGVNDGRYLRVEDVILTLAEAQYISGNRAEALLTLNKLRDARYSSYTGGESGEDLFEAIINERRKELAFENGDRFFTLKRLMGVPGIPAKYSKGIQRSGAGHRANGSGTPSAAQVLPANSIKWQLPILQSTLNIDKNIGQTTGY